MSSETMADILKVFVYSVNICLTGLFPFEDIYGNAIPEGGKQYLAGGWRGVLTEIKGGFPRWDQALNMCFVCGASGISSAHAFSIAAKEMGGDS